MAIITPPEANLPPESMQWGRSVDQNIINLDNNAARNFANIDNQLQQLNSAIELLSDNISQIYQVEAPVKTATITAATGNGTTITYTANNDFIVGEYVNIVNLPVTTGSSLNSPGGTLWRVATRSDTAFTVTATTVGTSSGPGTATILNTWSYTTSTYEPGGASNYYPVLLMSLPNGRNYAFPGQPYETGYTITLNKSKRIILDIDADVNMYMEGGPVDAFCYMNVYYSINNGPWVQTTFKSLGVPNNPSSTTYTTYNDSHVSSSDIISLPAGDHSIRVKWSAVNRAYGDITLTNPTFRVTTI